MRLDVYLYDLGVAQSRQKAQELIDRGVVWVDGKRAFKNSLEVTKEAQIEIKNGDKQWVARSGEKLWRFLLSCDVGVRSRSVLDVGSSTGGFSEVLLELGAKSIVCVDVGNNQLHSKIRMDQRVSVFENQDIRFFNHAPFDLVVCDVSFISLDLILSKLYELSLKDCILLFKPQFEVGKTVKRSKRGVILDEKRIKERLEEFLSFSQKVGFVIEQVEKSKLKGKCGNEEYFIYLSK